MIYQEVLLLLSDIFNKHCIDYFVTGSLAVAFYGRERSSHDFDFKLSVSPQKTASLVSALKELPTDFSYDEESVLNAVKTRSQNNIIFLPENLKIDLWFNDRTAFDKERFKRKKAQVISGQKIYFASPEDMILIKLSWYKQSGSDRHLEDAASVLQIQKNLDIDYLNFWAKKLKVTKYLKQLEKIPVQEW